MNVAAERRKILAQIRKYGKKGGDAWLQKYVGSPLPVLGLSVPQMRAILAAFRKEHRDVTAKEANALAAAIWRGKTFEEKEFAIMMLDAYARILDEASWRLLDSWVDGCVGWGMCDSIGAGPIAKLVYAKPARFRDLFRWTKARNPWRRRIALYALHDFVLAEELDKPFALIKKLAYDEEFWVQRAVGTWLRECWKRDETRTKAVLRRHANRLPALVVTVATERAPETFREELRRRAKALRGTHSPQSR
jgi:3-methyladenine DNA glycosylase AlkD